METTRKASASHLERRAFLYVRQSSPRQVRENTESTERQYALKQRAVALGWPMNQITVVDDDQGQSGESAADREGFQKLVTEVSMGRAGIVLGLEVSRLARNCADWHRLLEICALTDTLILDEDGIYHPADFNDRFLLGMKGEMSAAELHVIRGRLRGGLLNKAKRGELAMQLPLGLAYDDAGRVVLDPDQQVQKAFRLLFETFRRVGTAFGVVRVFCKQGLRFPRRGASPGEWKWGELEHSQVLRTLRNPRYAGAYFYGRTKHRKKIERKGTVFTRLPREQWHTLILDAHPGYISWEEYEENLRRLKENAQTWGVTHRQCPPREGPALLQGVVICGRCGGRMTVFYHSRQGRLLPYYRCVGRKDADQVFQGECQSITGHSIDQAIGDLLVEALNPLALEVTLAVQQELQARWEETDRLRRAQVDRARYEAELARRRFLRVDPENRLVAASLESDWNEKLRALAEAEQHYERQREHDGQISDPNQRQRILSLASDFPRLWRDPNTPQRERKRMVRLLIEDVTLRKAEQIEVSVRFRGGVNKTFSIPRPLGYFQSRKQSPALITEIDRLLDHHNYREVAALLNARGYKTGGGLEFDSVTISRIRIAYHLKDRYDRLCERGLLTLSEMAEKRKVSVETIRRWQRLGVLRAHPYNDQNACLYEDPGPTGPKKGIRLPDHPICKEVQCEA
jgi:DNA invertase Pin-like site-specific DNA recombinase